MSYTVRNMAHQTSKEYNISNCTITGNASAYKLNNDDITCFDYKNGKIDKTSAESDNEIALRDYQIAVLDVINQIDGSDELSINDVAGANKDKLISDINAAMPWNQYSVKNLTITDDKIDVTLYAGYNGTSHIGIEFDKPAEMPKEEATQAANNTKNEETKTKDQPKETEKEENNKNKETPKPKSKNIFAKIWDWIKGLFS